MAFLYKAYQFSTKTHLWDLFNDRTGTLKLQFEDWSEYTGSTIGWEWLIWLIWLDDGMLLDGLKDVGWWSKAILKLIPNQARTFMQSWDFIWKAFLSFPANKKVTHPQLDRLVLNRPQIRQTPQFQNLNKNYSNCKLFHYQPRHQLFSMLFLSMHQKKHKNAPFFLCVCVCVVSFFKTCFWGVNNSSPHGFGLNQKTNPTGNGCLFFGSGVVLDVGPEKTMALKARKNLEIGGIWLQEGTFNMTEWELLLMEEILHHMGWLKPCK